MMKNQRMLRVGYKYQNRAFQQMVMIPEIKLTGKWLKESGFEEGQNVKVVVQKNKLIITPDKNE